MIRKRVAVLLASLALLVGITVGAVGAGNVEKIVANLDRDIRIVYNGETQIMTNEGGYRVYPIVYNGTTYLPVRALANLFGVPVDWDGENYQVVLGTTEEEASYAEEVVRLVNEIRVQNGLSAFTHSEELSRVAQLKSQDMHDQGYFSHTSPTYGSPFDMMKQFGISYRTAGENIARGYSTPEAVVNGWMNSEGHRANILNASFTQIGVGYVSDGNYWTQMFIG